MFLLFFKILLNIYGYITIMKLNWIQLFYFN